MPRTTLKTNPQEPRKTRRARARAARYADRDRAATTPGEQHKTAAGYLLAAVKNARSPDRHAGRLAATYDPDVRELLSHTHLGGKRAQLYRDQLDRVRAPTAQLAQTLRLLHAVVSHLQTPDGAHAHYAQQLTAEARRVEAPHLTGRR